MRDDLRERIARALEFLTLHAFPGPQAVTDHYWTHMLDANSRYKVADAVLAALPPMSDLERENATLREALDTIAHWKVAQSSDAVEMRTFARNALGEQTPPADEYEQVGCPKCGYSGGCMESWDVGDGTLIDCGTCPACLALGDTPEPEAT